MKKFTLKLKTPLFIGIGDSKKEYKELVFDYSRLTGADAIAADQEMALKTELANINEYSPAYLGKIAARAARVDSRVIESLPIREYNVVTRNTQIFLLGMDSGEANLEAGPEDNA